MDGSGVWSVLLGVGTTVTLTIIVMIALALGALAFFYLSSAVVVLERFARRARRLRWVIVFGALVAAVAAYLSLENASELGVDPVSIGVGSAVSTVVAILSCWAGLRWLQPARLGTLALVGLGLAGALLVGAAGRLDIEV